MFMTRRSLLSSAVAGSTLAAVAPGLKVARAAGATNNILVVLFLRGGADSLQMVAPSGDANYIAARPTIRVPASGQGAGLALGNLAGTDFFLHPSLPELKSLFDAKKMAVIHATGVLTEDRSHFTVQDFMERGVADQETALSTGWLARHLNNIELGTAALSAIFAGPAVNTSLIGDAAATAIANSNAFNVTGGDANSKVIRAIVAGGNTAYDESGRRTLDDVATVQAALRSSGSSTGSSAGYTTGDLSQPLQSLAALIKANIGVTAATVDMNGWDHHQALVPGFQSRGVELSRSLNAFWNDLSSVQDRLTIVVMTEFGRRLQENANQGLDHGSASVMLAMGAGVVGGKIFGTWPGLATSQLHGGDLKVTTDNRQVLAEVIVKRHAEMAVNAVFPTITYSPLGVFV